LLKGVNDYLFFRKGEVMDIGFIFCIPLIDLFWKKLVLRRTTRVILEGKDFV
jgi:hypothetical protein